MKVQTARQSHFLSVDVGTRDVARWWCGEGACGFT